MFCFRLLGATFIAGIFLNASTTAVSAANRIVNTTGASTGTSSSSTAFSVIHSFTGGADGGDPVGLVADATGALYGTTTYGGPGCGSSFCGGGVVFRLTPPARGQTAWTESVLHSFPSAATDGLFPAFVSFDRHGDLYGTTAGGGIGNGGTVFKLTRPTTAAGAWTESVLYSFTGTNGDGSLPLTALTFDRAGALYGTTFYGGLVSASQQQGNGIAFKLTPPASGGTAWTESIIHSFTGTNGDGSNPQTALLIDERGNLFGATANGGATLYGGTFFKLAPPAWGRAGWTETVLHNFTGANGDDPANFLTPYGGAIYGTTVGGGTNCPQSSGCGVVFKLTRAGWGNATWSESVLHSFDGSDGNAPYEGVIVADHALLGTTGFGGAANMGTVFRLTPPERGRATWKETVLHTFTGNDGSFAIVLLSNCGALYGATAKGGAFNQGTVFELK